MKLTAKKGFIIILVTVSLAVLILSASVIVSIGCSELLATRVRNDLLVSAYYLAISGCERMYAHQFASSTTNWNTPMTGTLSVGSNTIGMYTATAYNNTYDAGAKKGTYYIVSTGTVNGHTATATVKLGYSVSYSGPLAVGAYGAATLNGSSKQAKIMMQGPVASSTGTPTLVNPDNISISGTPQTISSSGTPKVSFFDIPITNPSYSTNPLTILKTADGMGEGGVVDKIVTITEAQAYDLQYETTEAVAAYNTVNTYTTGDAVTEKDAFYYYYTTYLNDPANNPLGQTLNIGSSGSRYYSGDQTFGTDSIPDSVPIIFVNGNCTIDDNDGATTDHTVVVTGNLTLHQPSNGPGDRNSYIVYGNVLTDGEMGHGGGTKGDLVIFANGNIEKQGGGKMNASFFCNGTLTLNTAGDTGKKHLMLSRLTEDWGSGLSQGPLGIPPQYPVDIVTGFHPTNQTNDPPVWQRPRRVE